VIGERQPLDVVKQVRAQAQGDPLGGEGCQPAAEEREAALHQRQADEAQSHQEQGRHGGLFAQDVVHEMAQQQIGAGLGQRGDGQAGGGREIKPAIAGEHPPKAEQAIGRDSVFEIVGRGNDDRRHVRYLRKMSKP